jgi:nucleoid-associated protein YgaU
LKGELDALGPWGFQPPTDLLATEKVKVGDTLSEYAQQHYHDARLWPKIFEANRDTIDDPDEIFPGQEIRIPCIA